MCNFVNFILRLFFKFLCNIDSDNITYNSCNETINFLCIISKNHSKFERDSFKPLVFVYLVCPNFLQKLFFILNYVFSCIRGIRNYNFEGGKIILRKEKNAISTNKQISTLQQSSIGIILAIYWQNIWFLDKYWRKILNQYLEIYIFQILAQYSQEIFRQCKANKANIGQY